MDKIAVKAENVRKKFRRMKIGGGRYTTLKSAFIGAFLGKGSAAAEKSFEALKDVSFEVPAGRTWGIIGRNGSGKSTLLKLLAGIYKPDSGSLSLSGRVSALIELGAGFHPEFSGRENVFINASILGMTKAEIRSKFDEIVGFAELEEFIDDPVRTYSSGMFMRLGFSVAIHADPEILLVDEVLAVGDRGFSYKCKDKINGFRKSGKTIIIVTHDMGDVAELCDTAVWLEAGQVKAIDTPKRVIDGYLTSMARMENESMLKSAPKGGNGVVTGSRWGTKEVIITRVAIRDSAGGEKRVFGPQDPVTLVMDFMAPSAVRDAVFGFAIYRKDGTLCYGANTHIEGIELPVVQDQGSVSLRIQEIGLVDGSYTFSVASHAKDGHPYDYHDQMYEFHVRSGLTDVGIYRPRHQWSVEGVRTVRKINQKNEEGR
ncbi:MAG: ABC transporter ATP-binding protein [Nitrospinota bacterium]|nr:ABC transporter ATP-binding protein [Nitrospinota bacterium]